MQGASGLYDYGLRFYSPSLGRFINRDPSGEAGGLNLYAAFANNPLSFVDAYGLSPSSMASAFGRGIRDGIFSMEGLKAFGEAAITAAATAFLLGSCCPVVPLLTMAIGLVGAAIGMAGLLEAVSGILMSDLCPDEKAYQLGKMIGTMIAGAAGGGLGGKFGPKNAGCFVAGTLVLMADGTTKPIEQVKEDEWVMARDEATGKTEARQVKQKSVKYVDATRVLTFSDGSKIETTDEHPFYVESRGFLPAKEAGIGTSIVTRAGPTLRVTNVEVKTEGATVYNFEVEGLHTYFVGDSQVWVHNAKCPPNHAAVRGDKEHVTIEVNDNGKSLTTDRKLEGMNDIPEGIVDAFPAPNEIFIPLPDPKAAMAAQRQALADNTPYNLNNNSCMTHVTDVLKAGGVANMPSGSTKASAVALMKLGGIK